MNGIRSLNAGAYANLPQQDIRLSGDHRGSYVQRRRAQMAGGGIMGSNAGSMLVAPTADGSRPGYGILDSIKKRVGKLIPNELKNPLGATAAAVAANYLPTVLGKETVLSQLGKLPFIGPVAETIGNIGTGIGDIIKGPDEKWGGVDIFGLPGRIGDAITPDMTYIDTKGQKQKINYGLPLALGAAAGEYQRQYLKDQPAFPMDETGIKFQTAQEAMDAPNLRFKPEAQYANVAEGGRIGYRLGGNEKEKDIFKAWDRYKSGGGQRQFQGWFRDVWFPTAQGLDEPMDIEDWRTYAGSKEPMDIEDWLYQPGVNEPMDIEDWSTRAAQGGRIGYQDAGDVEIPEPDTGNILKNLEEFIKKRKGYEDRIMRSERIDAAEGGLMDLGGMEKDYRQEGGFVPIGGQEKADDVPARLSKNEFVFTADAVRAAGGGDIDAGAEVMENLMENLEAGGKVSEESQGLEGARDMFANAQELEKRII